MITKKIVVNFTLLSRLNSIPKVSLFQSWTGSLSYPHSVAKDKKQNQQQLQIIKNTSPIAWAQINLHGLDQFRNVKVNIDWKALFN